MKKILVIAMAAVLTLCLFSCSLGNSGSNDGFTDMTGCIVTVYEGENVLGSFYSESALPKEITLNSDSTYRIAVAPSFNESRDTQFSGNCASFKHADGVCSVKYIGHRNYQPSYELTVLSSIDFEIQVGVGAFSQIIKVKVA